MLKCDDTARTRIWTGRDIRFVTQAMTQNGRLMGTSEKTIEILEGQSSLAFRQGVLDDVDRRVFDPIDHVGESVD